MRGRGPGEDGEERASVSSETRTLQGFCYVVVLVAALSVARPSARAASAYEDLIAPILRVRCAECHGEQKQKAKLALHTWDALVRGSDAGAVFVAGKPGDSPLVARMQLPVTDEEHMPPAEKAQPTPEEIAVLLRWIEHGASKTATLAELDLSATLAAAAAGLPAKLAAIAQAQGPVEPLWEFDAEAVEKLRAPLSAQVAELQRRFPGALSYESRTSATLQFTAVGFGRDFGAAELAALAPLREHLVSLDLSGTGITDEAADVIGGLVKLRVFRASATRLSDTTVRRLAALPVLESVSLMDTAITAESIAVLSKLRTLRSLRVAGTPAEQPAQAANLPVGPSAADLIPKVSAEPETKPAP